MSRTGLWDSHAHLDDEAFNEDREQLIAQLEQDMDGIVNPGCDATSSAVAVELAGGKISVYICGSRLASREFKGYSSRLSAAAGRVGAASEGSGNR